MGAKLQALLTLQDIELQIVEIRRQMKRKERQVRAQKKKLDVARAALEAERSEIMHAQARFDELDLDIKGRSTNIDRLREHLNTVRTNKDYAVVLAQMNNEKADVKTLETKALELMQGVDSRKQGLSEHEQLAAAEESRLEELEAQLEQTNASFAARLQQLEDERTEAGGVVEAEVLKLFERLSVRYDGEAMAEVEQVNPRRDEFVCTGCHMSKRIEVANALRSRDDVITCKNCGRILFMK